MNEIYCKSRAKINLTFEITDKREDGYHEIESILQTIHLYDELHIKRVKRNELTLKTNLPYLPTNEKNLVLQAAHIIKDMYAFSGGLHFDLYKRIPVSAGLGGGSSNCATALIGMNTLLNLNIPFESLTKIASSLGADIPFLLTGGTQLATGFGEKLKTLPPFPFAFVLIIKPPAIVSTKDVFSNVSASMINKKTETAAFINAYKKGVSHIPAQPKNVLESITSKKYPIILDLKKDLLDNQAFMAQMSGSGATVFGLFKDKNVCYTCKTKLQKKYPFIKTWFITGIDNQNEIPMKKSPYKKRT